MFRIESCFKIFLVPQLFPRFSSPVDSKFHCDSILLGRVRRSAKNSRARIANRRFVLGATQEKGTDQASAVLASRIPCTTNLPSSGQILPEINSQCVARIGGMKRNLRILFTQNPILHKRICPNCGVEYYRGSV